MDFSYFYLKFCFFFFQILPFFANHFQPIVYLCQSLPIYKKIIESHFTLFKNKFYMSMSKESFLCHSQTLLNIKIQPLLSNKKSINFYKYFFFWVFFSLDGESETKPGLYQHKFFYFYFTSLLLFVILIKLNCLVTRCRSLTMAVVKSFLEW